MKTFLIIGASRGLGLEFARQLASVPDTLVLATHRAGGCTPALAALAEEHAGTVRLFELDFTSQASLDALVPQLPEIDRLVVNAGFNGARDPLLSPGEGIDMAADLVEAFRINTVGPVSGLKREHCTQTQNNREPTDLTPHASQYLTTKALHPLLSSGAKIMYLSSSLASLTEATHDMSPSYSVSKVRSPYFPPASVPPLTSSLFPPPSWPAIATPLPRPRAPRPPSTCSSASSRSSSPHARSAA